MKKTGCTIYAVIMMLFAISGIFAQQATIQDIAGTVELKRPGSSGWEAAVKGQALTADTAVSTGFGSTALIRAGSTVITVRPLTRLTLSELIAAAGTESVNVNLQAGRVRVDVNPPAGTKTNAYVRGPTAVASVRGTVFEIDTYNLTVIEGTVEFTGSSGPGVLIDAGRSSFADETTGRAAAPAETAIAELWPEVPIGSDPIQPSARPESGGGVDLTVTISF